MLTKQPNTDYRVKAGHLEVEILCDASALDAALLKMNQLLEKTQQAQKLGVLPAGMVVASVLRVAGTPQHVSRRSLLGLGWLKS